MDIYVLEYTSVYCGNRIEGFSVDFSFYKDKQDALDDAYKRANDYFKRLYHNDKNCNWRGENDFEEKKDNFDVTILLHNKDGNYC